MKKVYVIIICVLLAFIPTYVALGSYFTTRVNPVAHDTVDKIVIVSPTGETNEIAREFDTDGFIELAVSMNENAEKILGLPEPLLDNDYFEFTYYSYDRSSVYKYYFDSKSSDAYYVDDNGLAYHITDEYAQMFLKTSYAHCIYPYSTAPIFKLNSTSISPSNADWQFKGSNGEFTEAHTAIGDNTALETYGTPVFDFDIEPDTVTVSLSENGVEIYDGYDTDLANNDFSGRELSAHIVATWYDSSDRDYRGEIAYDLSIKFKEPPIFFISSKNASSGDLLTISVLNAEDPSKINLKCEPSLGCDPVFYSDGEYARALIPISTSVLPGDYTISADYASQSSTVFKVEVSSRYTASYPYNIEDTVFSGLYTDANIDAYNKLFDSLFENLTNERLFDGKFSSGLPTGTFESADIGDLLTISQNDISFENPGIYYSCTKVSNVTAVNSGVVIYAGSDNLAGNIVAVDHGLGLISIYKHLGSVSVKVGDSVDASTVIGVSGRTGLMSKKSAHISVARVELYVDKIPVNISPLINSGVNFAN